MDLYKKHERQARKTTKFSNFIKKIKSDLPYVVVRFRESEKINSKDERIADFIEETAGKYASESIFGGIFGDFEIHYENMRKADDWFRVWNDFSKESGNDLSTPRPEYQFEGLKDGDQWCLCAARWEEARQAGKAPIVVLEATNIKCLEICKLEDLKKHAGGA